MLKPECAKYNAGKRLPYLDYFNGYTNVNKALS